MIDKDLYNLLTAVNIIDPEALDADTTPASIDLQGYGGAVVLIHVGVGGITFTTTNKVDFVLTHSDDDSTFTAVALADVEGPASVSSGIIKTLSAAHAAATVTEVGYKGGKRYLKLLADFSGTHGTATPMGALVVKGGADLLPAS